MNCSTPGFPVLHHLLEFAQTHVYWVGDHIWKDKRCDREEIHVVLSRCVDKINLKYGPR